MNNKMETEKTDLISNKITTDENIADVSTDSVLIEEVIEIKDEPIDSESFGENETEYATDDYEMSYETQLLPEGNQYGYLEETTEKSEIAVEAIDKEDDLDCYLCKFRGRTKNSLKTHIRSSHRISKLQMQCLLCNRIFKRPSNLKHHIYNKHLKNGVLKEDVDYKILQRLDNHAKESVPVEVKSEAVVCWQCGFHIKRPTRWSGLLESDHHVESKCPRCYFKIGPKKDPKPILHRNKNPSRTKLEVQTSLQNKKCELVSKSPAGVKDERLTQSYRCHLCEFQDESKRVLINHIKYFHCSLHNKMQSLRGDKINEKKDDLKKHSLGENTEQGEKERDSCNVKDKADGIESLKCKPSETKDLEKRNEFTCFQCGFATPTTAIFIDHLENSHNDEFSCPRCNFTTTNEASLAIHVASEHGTDENTVKGTEVLKDDNTEKRPAVFEYETSSGESDKDMNNDFYNCIEGEYSCSRCNLIFIKKQNLDSHLKIHMDTKIHDLPGFDLKNGNGSNENDVNDKNSEGHVNTALCIENPVGAENNPGADKRDVKCNSETIFIEIESRQGDNSNNNQSEQSKEASRSKVLKEKPSDTRDYRCRQCELALSGKLNYLKHMKTVHKVKEFFRCHLCDFTASKRNFVLKHMRYVHNPNVFVCRYCDSKVRCKDTLNLHMRFKHQISRKLEEFVDYVVAPQCKGSEKSEKNDGALRGIKWLPKFARSQNDAGNGGASRNRQPEFANLPLKSPTPTPINDRPTGNEKELESITVEVTYSDEDEAAKRETKSHFYKCQYCNYCSKDKEVLLAHIERQNHKDLELLQCPYCDFTSYMKRQMTGHVEREHHGEIKQLKCSDCEYLTESYQKWMTHKRKHKVPKSKIANDISYLMDEHENFECFICGYKARYFDHLESHMAGLHSDKSVRDVHLCFICGCQYKNKHALDTHLQDHEERTYKCEYCSYESHRKVNLKMHVTKTHRDKKLRTNCLVVKMTPAGKVTSTSFLKSLMLK